MKLLFLLTTLISTVTLSMNHEDIRVEFETGQDPVCLDNFDGYDGKCKSLSWNGSLIFFFSAFDRKTNTRLGKVTFEEWYPCEVERMWINKKAIDEGISSGHAVAKELLLQAVAHSRLARCHHLSAWMRKDETSLFTQVGGKIDYCSKEEDGLCKWVYEINKVANEKGA